MWTIVGLFLRTHLRTLQTPSTHTRGTHPAAAHLTPRTIYRTGSHLCLPCTHTHTLRRCLAAHPPPHAPAFAARMHTHLYARPPTRRARYLHLPHCGSPVVTPLPLPCALPTTPCCRHALFCGCRGPRYTPRQSTCTLLPARRRRGATRPTWIPPDRACSSWAWGGGELPGRKDAALNSPPGVP